MPKLGMEPLNEFSAMLKTVSLVALVIEVGIGPLSLFELKRSHSRLKSECPMSEGRLPENSLYERAKVIKVDELNMKDGMEPVKELLNTWKRSRIGKLPISWGNSPAVYI